MIKKSTWVAIPDQVSANLQGESVILHLTSGIYYGLDPVGARVLELMQKPIAFNDLKTKLLNEYDVEPDRCEQDLEELLQKLADAKLIEVVNAAGE